jgi:hypothetical protein
MATKAERFKSEMQRTGTGKRKPKAAASKPSRARKAAFAYEETPPSAVASRKSTRRGKNRQKAAVPLKAKQELKLISPQSRHDQDSRR